MPVIDTNNASRISKIMQIVDQKCKSSTKENVIKKKKKKCQSAPKQVQEKTQTKSVTILLDLYRKLFVTHLKKTISFVAYISGSK